MDASPRIAAALLLLLSAAPASAETPADEEVGIADVADVVDGEVIDDVADEEVITDTAGEDVGSDADPADGSSPPADGDAVADADPDSNVDGGAADVDAEVDAPDVAGDAFDPDTLDVDADDVTDASGDTDAVMDAVDPDAAPMSDISIDAEGDLLVEDGGPEQDGGAEDVTAEADAPTDAIVEDVPQLPVGDLEFRTSVQLRGGANDQLISVLVSLDEMPIGRAEGSAGEVVVVPDLSLGDYDVVWESSGYAPARAMVALPAPGVYSVVLYPATELTLSGQVSVAGSPVGGVTLTLTGLSAGLNGLDPVTVVSGESGDFEFVSVAAGRYRLGARSGEFTATLSDLELLQDTTVNLRLVDETAFPPLESESGCVVAPAERRAPWNWLMAVAGLFLLHVRRGRSRV